MIGLNAFRSQTRRTYFGAFFCICSFIPDFTILHPLTGKEIYWEHFGKIDLPEYAKNAADKLHVYAKNGIYPGDGLITTYETMEQPLDTAIVQKLITYHFKDS